MLLYYYVTNNKVIRLRLVLVLRPGQRRCSSVSLEEIFYKVLEEVNGATIAVNPLTKDDADKE